MADFVMQVEELKAVNKSLANLRQCRIVKTYAAKGQDLFAIAEEENDLAWKNVCQRMVNELDDMIRAGAVAAENNTVAAAA